MACEFWTVKLDLYVDGELTPPEAQEFATHLRNCAGCAAEVLERVQFKRSVALAGKRYAPSAEFRAKIQKAVGAEPKRQGAWFWRIIAIPAALVLMLSLAVNWYVDREKARRERIYGELADLHVTTLASATPVDVISEDRHTVKPWFQGKIPFSFNLPELQGTDFSLVGGRVTYLPSGPVSTMSFNVESWTKSGLRYFVVGDVSREDIEKLSKLLRDVG
jgi:anti-sigma factor RsiW